MHFVLLFFFWSCCCCCCFFFLHFLHFSPLACLHNCSDCFVVVVVAFFFFIFYFSITSKVITKVILIVYVLGHKYVWSPSQSHLKTILSWAQNIFMPVDINSLLFYHM